MAQQELQNSSFDSKLDCSAVINGFDSDDASTSGHSFNRLEPETSSSSTQNFDSQGVQALVNQQILAQLSPTTDRLTKLEDKKNKENQ